MQLHLTYDTFTVKNNMNVIIEWTTLNNKRYYVAIGLLINTSIITDKIYSQ